MANANSKRTGNLVYQTNRQPVDNSFDIAIIIAYTFNMENKEDKIEEDNCIHKWKPNGMEKQKVLDLDIAERVFASCICQNCGKIKSKRVDDQ